MTNCSSDLPYMHDEFDELLWDNGPVTLNRRKRSSIYGEDSKDKPYPKIGHFKAIDSKINNFPIPGMNNNVQDDDIVPWINYPMEDEDPLHNFITDYPIHSQNVVPTIKSSYLDQLMNNSHKLSEINSNIGGSSNSKAHTEANGIGVVNFSHFSRPKALGKANVESIRNKANFEASNNPVEPILIESTSNVKRVLGNQGQLTSIQLKPLQDVTSFDMVNDICEKNVSKKESNPDVSDVSRSPERIQSSSFMSSVAIKRHENDKGNETIVASSSACSGSSAWEKRKVHEGEESGYQSEDIEVGSVDLRKPPATQGKNKKRSRAAEVHNLSERRRRDRINERMRALQELIPNCNKTDKASMLDEAIDYLKSLQMQVQIMSLSSGLCMPPMMMQHLRAPMMAHYSPMGIGLNYGMGLYDMNSSPRCSFFPLSPIQGPHFPYSSIQGTLRPNNFNMFGVQGPIPNRPPIASIVDTKTTPAQQNDNLEKIRSSNGGDMQI